MRVVIELNEELAAKYKLYAALAHSEIKPALQHALHDWMDTIGEGDIEAMSTSGGESPKTKGLLHSWVGWENGVRAIR